LKHEDISQPTYGDPQYRPNPTFPELAYRFLTNYQLQHLSDTKIIERSEWEKRAPLGKAHYDLLKTIDGCNRRQLDQAYKRWIRMAKHRDSKRQLHQLLRNAENWRQKVRNYEALSKGLSGTEAEKDEFWNDWMKEGLRQLNKSILAGKSWVGFLGAECYQWHRWGIDSWNLLDFRHEGQIKEPNMDVDQLLGPYCGDD
jgi:hypothetical protein